MSGSDGPGLISRSEAEKLLGAHPQQLKRLLDSGWIESVKQAGRLWVVSDGLREKWENRPRRRVKQARPCSASVAATLAEPTPPADPTKPRPAPGRRATRTSATPPAAVDADPSVLGGYGFPEIPRPGTVPNLEEQKAWTEFNKRYKTHLDLFKDAGLLVFREDYDKAQNAVIQEIIRQGDILPRIIQQRIPKLTVEDMEEIEDIVREMFAAVSDAEFEDLDQGEE